MSFIHWRNEIAWYYWSEGGKKKGKSLKTRDKDLAPILRGEEDRRRLMSKAGMSSPDSRWKAFLDDYLKYSKANKGPATHEKDSLVLAAFQKSVNPVFFNEVPQRVIESYMAQVASQTSKGNANVHYRHLKAAFNKAVAWDYLPRSPFVGVKQFKLEKRPPRFLSKAEIDEMLTKAKNDPNDSAYGLSMAFLWTGMRLAEVLGLKWADVDFKQGWIKAFGKGQKERRIPLHSKLERFLRSSQKPFTYVFGGDVPMNRSTVQHIFRDRLLPPGTSIHTLRHTFASHSVMSGMDLKTLQEILGHESITTTMIYAHLASPHIKEGMEKVTFR